MEEISTNIESSTGFIESVVSQSGKPYFVIQVPGQLKMFVLQRTGNLTINGKWFEVEHRFRGSGPLVDFANEVEEKYF